MNNLQEIKTELADILSVSTEQLTPSLVLEDDGNWDSLAHVSVIAMIINLTGAKSTQQEMQKLTSVQEIFDLIAEKSSAETA
ncbi:hypothetical protein BGP78_09775 [Pseudoalteromonas sp. MSK9-3]|uniref:acyl carrier protein n=1 Tax=Pseudoalteromonas sp. MSK9-3 TaxID=1897633 RepID=UPI000E6C6998|nr:acyl carrier protein [Pseudoalteromonas sp. MSK9-3]RJE77180.1 hypothetical protein BGP78_09775 [Pseudoalteromonas sp. MSK9-3]